MVARLITKAAFLAIALGAAFFGLPIAVILPRPPHGTGQIPCIICHANDATITAVTAA